MTAFATRAALAFSAALGALMLMAAAWLIGRDNKVVRGAGHALGAIGLAWLAVSLAALFGYVLF